MKNPLVIKSFNKKTRHLFKMVTERDFLVQKGGKLYISGRPLDEKELGVVAEQAKTMQGMLIWPLLLNEMTNAANKKIFFDSVTMDDVVFGKAVLWTLDVLSKKVNSLASIKK